MTSPNEVWSLACQHLGRRVHVYDRLDSTNTLALALADDRANDGLALLAREQTAGRGQYGRSWQAPAGSSVLLSLLVFPPPLLRRPVLLTAWAAVAVCATIHRLTQLPATIKWPNDVLAGGKKVCGILIEQRTTQHAQSPLATAVGIGLNVMQSAQFFAEAGLPLAASLSSLSGLRLEWDIVAKELLGQLDRLFALLLAGDCRMLEEQWKERLALVGKDVIVEAIGQSQRGRLLDVAFDGVAVETEAGEIVQLMPETIRHLQAPP